jgi:hypothetical protein
MCLLLFPGPCLGTAQISWASCSGLQTERLVLNLLILQAIKALGIDKLSVAVLKERLAE